MGQGGIRPIALCVFRKNDVFYRPLGGGFEFGEYGEQSISREIREEIGAEIADLRYLGALENIFTLEGQPDHEIVLVYEGVVRV